MEDAEEASEMDEDPEEARVPKVLKSPFQPTAQEVAERNLTHLPFRNWCPHCIMGKARNVSHKKQKRDTWFRISTLATASWELRRMKKR